MAVNFLHPTYIGLLALLPVVWFFHRGKNITQPLLRSLLVLLITLGLMQPVIFSSSDAVHQVVIVDQSQSMGIEGKQTAKEQANAFIASLSKDEVDVIVTGSDEVVVANDDINTIASASLSLTQAVALAIDNVPYGQSGTITLFSDGNATDDHWEPVLARLKNRDILLNWMKYKGVNQQPSIQSIDYSPFFPGETPTLTVNVQAQSNASSPLTLRVVFGDKTIQETRLDSNASEDNLYSATFDIAETTSDFLSLSVQLVNNSAQLIDTKSVILAAQSPVPVLLGSQNQSDHARMQALLGNAFSISQIPYPWSESTDFERFDAVILNDAAKSALPLTAQLSLTDAVKGGTGLLYSGSEQAFSNNGLSSGPLADILPVSIDNTETKREPGISLAIIIDSSGSMQGQPLELAKQVARLAVRKLKPQDQVGIVEFYGTRQWAVPIQSVQSTEDLERAIGKLQAQGGSELFPAIEEAYFGLKNSHNKYRHILVITDAAVEEENYQKLLQYIASDQINVSTVLVGENASGEQRMSALANWGKGRFYAIYNEFNMVELNFRRSDKLPASAYKTGSFLIRDTDSNAPFPIPLNGYTSAPLKPSAVPQWAVSNSSDALLASWHSGAGKVSALMTEPFGEGTQRWADWPEYGEKLGDVVASLTAMAKKSALKAERDFDSVHVQFDSTLASNSPVLQWKRPSDPEWSQSPLRQRAPGLFTSDISVPREQAVLITVDNENRTYRTALAPNSDLYPEYQSGSFFTQRLSQVVEGSGGHFLTPSSLTKTTEPSGKAYVTTTALMPFALLASLLLYFIEIIYRRWPKRRNAHFAGKAV